MASKFYKNAVLMGSVDSYCLACDSYLRCEEDCNMHIEKPIHKKNLDTALYVEKYQNEHIRKVKKGYYCEFCNLLFPTAAKVGLHVDEKTHNNNKGTNLLKRVGNSVTAFKNLVINEKAWNGFIDDTCVICNSEFDNENIHKAEQTHLLSLVQSKLEFGDDNSIYRKIDDSSYQCLTCNLVLSMTTITTHFDNKQHKELYAKCRDDMPVSKSDNTPASKSENTPDKTPVRESVDQFSKEEILLPFEKVERENVPLPNVKKPSTETAKKLAENSPKTDSVDPDTHYCNVLDAKDYIMNDKGKLWCIICEWTMDSVAVVTHLTGQHHQTLLKLHKARIAKRNATLKKKTIEPVDTDREKILDSVSKYQSNDINIDFFSCTAYCKKCSKNIDFVSNEIESHIEEHQKKIKKESTKVVFVTGSESTQNNAERHSLFTKPVFIKKDEGKAAGSRSNSVTSLIDEEVENFAKQNNITTNRVDNKAHCKICDTQVPTSLKSMKEHISGGAHRNKLAKQSEVVIVKKPVTLTKQTTSEFILHLTSVENIYIKEIVINYKYVLNIYSFFFITKQNLDYKCETCDVSIDDGQIDSHKSTSKHECGMQTASVITSVDSELIREPRPGVYHCGFCNTVEYQWSNMLDHLLTAGHRESRVAAEWRLREYLPDIRNQQRRKDMEMMFMMRLLTNRNMF